MLSQEKLKTLLNYNPDSGVFSFKKARGCRKAGDIAGSFNRGYISIKVDGRKYSAHRLAFLYMEGAFPEDGLDVDHINRVKDDNRWKNLRVVTRTLNALNTGCNKNNELGSSNIRVLKDTGRYQVRIAGKSLGCFDTLEEAEKCYVESRIMWELPFATIPDDIPD